MNDLLQIMKNFLMSGDIKKFKIFIHLLNKINNDSFNNLVELIRNELSEDFDKIGVGENLQFIDFYLKYDNNFFKTGSGPYHHDLSTVFYIPITYGYILILSNYQIKYNSVDNIISYSEMVDLLKQKYT